MKERPALYSFILALFLSFSAFVTTASAHEGRPIYIEVEQKAEGIFVLKWKIPPVMPDASLPLITLIGGECKSTIPVAQARLAGVTHFRCALKDPSPSVHIAYPDINPVLSTLVQYQSISGTHVSLLHGPDVTEIALPEKPEFIDVIKGYTITGIDHILSGYDHLAFVVCLMLLVTLGAKGGLKRLFYTVTGFTLGHSVTLGIVTLSGYSFSSTMVEALIALSIVMLAAEVGRGKHTTIVYRYPVLVATGFGLLHGMGFAGALAEIGLPETMEITALAFFNIGVEIGQILFIIGLLLVLNFSKFTLKKAYGRITSPSLAPFHYPLTLFIGSFAAFWTIERIIP